MEDLRQLVFTQRRNQNMHVVGRDDKLIKTIALSVKIFESIFHYGFHFGQP